MQIAGKIDNSLSNGEGNRYVLFVSGCSHNCEGCHNKHTWDYQYGDNINIETIIKDIKYNAMPLIDGITISGGEPFDQKKDLADLIQYIKSFFKLNIWCYTGYTYDELKNKKDSYINFILKNIDVLVDGKFEKDLYNSNLKYKGSENQKIIELKDGKIIGYKHYGIE